MLASEVEELIASLKREIEALRAENAELRRRLGLDSSNSSKPPSSDGLKKRPRILGSLRTARANRAAVKRATGAIRFARSPTPTGSSSAPQLFAAIVALGLTRVRWSARKNGKCSTFPSA